MRRSILSRLGALALTLCAAAAAQGAALQPFTADDLVRLKRISDPQV